MKDKKNYVAAIDIGTTKIVAIVGQKNEFKKLEIVGYSSTPSKGVRRGVVLNIQDTINEIQTVIRDVEEKTNIKIDEVFVGIAGQHIKSIQNHGYLNRDSTDDGISQNDIQKLIDDMYRIPVDSDEEILHVIPQSYIIDGEYSEKNPIGICGKRLEANFHIVIGKIASANNIKKCVNRVDIAVNSLILEPLASSQAVLTNEEKEAGVALIDIGGGTTDIAVFYDNVIRHTAVIPVGGNAITNDIKTEFAVINEQAEKLKKDYGSTLAELAPKNQIVTVPGINGRPSREISFNSLSHVIQARMEEIIGVISFELESSGYMNKLGAGIVITGGGSLLKHLPQLISFKTGLDVKIGYPNEHLAGNTDEKLNHPMFATSIGLLLEGYEILDKQNKIETGNKVKEAKTIEKPEEVKEEKKKKKPIFDNIMQKFGNFFEDEKIQ
ncbi:MAG: cell division protein FtsA [Bacteroidetes bacterium GWF2_33_38]|nr:MAG: cell division protein FtsA [Bacteroidetes bacterium GWF2_33_38]OFY74283.1 MAG: cell division protein FtsA [Bacteroidetes bacterium RIFOXYA12_FULL_33_9]OFY90001.1 MAG: cell division protein FtsA [Bacteroidetes bacterium RIFOXYA2_FULL_33_7]